MWITPASGQLRDLRQSIHISNPNFWWHSIRWSLFFCDWEVHARLSTNGNLAHLFLGPWSFQFGKPLWLQSLYYRLMMLQIHDVCMMFVISWYLVDMNHIEYQAPSVPLVNKCRLTFGAKTKCWGFSSEFATYVRVFPRPKLPKLLEKGPYCLTKKASLFRITIWWITNPYSSQRISVWSGKNR